MDLITPFARPPAPAVGFIDLDAFGECESNLQFIYFIGIGILYYWYFLFYWYYFIGISRRSQFYYSANRA